MIDLNELKVRVYENACNKGFHDVSISLKRYQALLVSEFSEVLEAYRKGLTVGRPSIDRCKDHLYYELSDIVIRCLDLAADCNIIIRPLKIGQEFPTSDDFIVYGMRCILTSDDVDTIVHKTLECVFSYSLQIGISLEEFIIEKMNYNSTRPYLHNKLY